MASHNNARWYSDADGFLEHSPSGGNLYYQGLTLQKIIRFWGVPHVFVQMVLGRRDTEECLFWWSLKKSKDDIPYWERNYPQKFVICGFPSDR